MKKITQTEFTTILELHDNWLKDIPGGVRANFSHCDLRAVNMAGANMAGAKMAGANMVGANMVGANMAGANMAGANMAGAKMAGANMEGANMEGANMEGANMARANMEGANMEGANMAGAKMAGANMEGANMEGANMEGANMEGANMEGANMARANMEGANMEEKYGKLIHAERSILQIGNVGRDNDFLTAFFCEKSIVIRRGCFYGTLDAFIKQVDDVHGNNDHAKEYDAVVKLILAHADIWGVRPHKETEAV